MERSPPTNREIPPSGMELKVSSLQVHSKSRSPLNEAPPMQVPAAEAGGRALRIAEAGWLRRR